jgi:hypothetical protein
MCCRARLALTFHAKLNDTFRSPNRFRILIPAAILNLLPRWVVGKLLGSRWGARGRVEGRGSGRGSFVLSVNLLCRCARLKRLYRLLLYRKPMNVGAHIAF